MATKSDDDTERSANSASPVSAMSLDVLAAVASDRLQTDDKLSEVGGKSRDLKNLKGKPVTKRSFQTMDRLNLLQIDKLSDKLLISMYSEMSSDELRKHYTLKCALEPGLCLYQVTVYGNEMKAKMEIKRHLQQHVIELKVKFKDGPECFTAETATGRKKRLLSEYNKKIKLKKKLKREPPPQDESGSKRRGRPPSFPQTLHDYAGLGVEIDKVLIQREAMRKDYLERQIDAHHAALTSNQPEQKNEEEGESTNSINDADKEDNPLIAPIKVKVEKNKNERMVDFSPMATTSGATILDASKSSLLDTEQLIIDLITRCQPYQDHNYTSILGKKKGIESVQCEYVSDEEIDPILESMSACRTDGRRVGLTVYPDVTAEMRSSISIKLNPDWNSLGPPYPVVKMTPSPNVTADELALSNDVKRTLTPEIIAWEHLKRLASKMTGAPRRSVYPPMPTTNLDKQGRIPEESLLAGTQSASDEEEQEPEQEEPPKVITNVNPYRRGRRSYDTMGGEWERKAALKCIRDLRSKRKEDTSLVCKICKNRTFTATATLMYHYRSHAGIKPFVCLICNTTFTRQHSLNYHMLIHNNQSRFTCRECGRKFRHPSHFKEHMRRHTGETPYHCTDCPLRFKTRNTYKRHLKTRHDKVLTSGGIRSMSIDEASRFRSMVKIHESGDTDNEEIADGGIQPIHVTVDVKANTEPVEPKKPTVEQIFSKSLPRLAMKIEPKEERKPHVSTCTNADDIAGIQSILNNTVQFKLRKNNAVTSSAFSATTTTPCAMQTQQMMQTPGTSFQVQIPSTQTLNISGIQLQLANQQIQLPNSQLMLQPSGQLAHQSGATTLQLPIMQSAALSQPNIPLQLPLMQDTTITQPGTPLQIPVVQPTAVAHSGAQLHFVQATSMRQQSGTTVQVLQAPTMTHLAQIAPAGGTTQYVISNPLLAQNTHQNTTALQIPTITALQLGNQGHVSALNQGSIIAGSMSGNTATLQKMQAGSAISIIPFITPITTAHVQSHQTKPVQLAIPVTSTTAVLQPAMQHNTPAANTLLRFCTEVAANKSASSSI